MQLFVTEYKKKDKNIIIVDSDLLSQLRKVMRASIGDSIWIQSPQQEQKKIRYELRIETWDNKMLEGTIISEQTHTREDNKSSMIIAMPNKWDKIDLIVQKLTECGIDQIFFWPSERSIIKEWNPKKEERLRKIMKEALEQSWGRQLPGLVFAPDIIPHLQNTEVIIFDTYGPRNAGHETKKEEQGTRNQSKIIGIVGPEGGLTQRDYQIVEGISYIVYPLGETILRTETAAIIAGRLLKNKRAN